MDAKLRERFDSEPEEVFLEALRDAGQPLTAKKIMAGLVAQGLPEPSVRKQWTAVQRDIIKYHPYVARPTAMSYAWLEKPVEPDEALTRLLDLLKTTSKSRMKLRDNLADLVRSGLRTVGEPGPAEDEARFRATQERQSQIDGLSAIAELAGEIEELAYNSGDPDVIAERLQTRVKGYGLDQIGRSGDDVTFDSSLHSATGPIPGPGSPATIVRPGYSWRHGKETVLLQKARVAAE